MGDVFASPNGKFQAVRDIEQCDSTIASTSMPMILRIGRRSPSRENVSHRSTSSIPTVAWFHFISTVPPTRMKDK
jgi:hypothetical protein